MIDFSKTIVHSAEFTLHQSTRNGIERFTFKMEGSARLEEVEAWRSAQETIVSPALAVPLLKVTSRKDAS